MTSSEALREADQAAWRLVGCIRLAMEQGVLDGAPEPYVRSEERYLRRIDECYAAVGIGRRQGGRA